MRARRLHLRYRPLPGAPGSRARRAPSAATAHEGSPMTLRYDNTLFLVLLAAFLAGQVVLLG